MNDDLQQKFDDLLFGVRLSVRYHSRRQGFYRNCHTLVMVTALLSGSATAVAFGTEVSAGLPLWVKLMPAMLITLLSAFDLVIRFSDKSYMHADFCGKFTELERQLETGRSSLSRELIKEVTDQRLVLEATEPPVLKVLATLIYNELVRAMGYKKSRRKKVSFWQRLFAPYFDLNEESLY